MTVKPSLVIVIAVVCCAFVATCGKKSASKNPDAPGSGSVVGPACSSDGSCAQPTPYCDVSAGHCVECIGNANCGMNRYCNPNDTCVQCLMDSQCGGQTPYCSPAGDCVQCLDTGNCGSGQTCNTNDYRCVATCTGSGSGSGGVCRPPTGVCDGSAGYCVQCVASTDCTANVGGGGGRVCDTTNNTCVECVMDSDCTMAPRTKCNTTDNVCVQCVTSADCTAPATCGLDGVCQ